MGIDNYLQMLDQAIAKLQDPQSNPLARAAVKLNIGLNAFLPEDYIQTQRQRLGIYQELTHCMSEEDVWNLRSGLDDSLWSFTTSLLDFA